MPVSTAAHVHHTDEGHMQVPAWALLGCTCTRALLALELNGPALLPVTVFTLSVSYFRRAVVKLSL